MSDLSPLQRQFLDLLISREALRFGDFTLKSGRKSPYFVNTGCFHTGGDLAALGAIYADTIAAPLAANRSTLFLAQPTKASPSPWPRTSR